MIGTALTGVTLTVDGRPHDGWTQISVSRSIERAIGEFGLTVRDRQAALTAARSIQCGALCTIAIDGEPVLVGQVDDLTVRYDGSSHELTLRGRDRAGDLVDCAAAPEGPLEYAGLTVLELAQRVAEAFGVPVRLEGDAGAAFPRFGISPEETAWSAIEKACRARALLALSDGAGGLVLTRGGTSRAPQSLTLPGNILSAEVEESWRDRHSDYIVKGTAEMQGSGRPASPGELAGEDYEIPGTAIEGRAIDDQIDRYRPLVTLARRQGDGQSLADQAAWHMRQGRAQGLRARYTVRGWRAGGQLWKPNTLVSVLDPWADIDRDLLISGVEYRLDANGTVTRLTVIPPESVDLEPEAAAKPATQVRARGDGLDPAPGAWQPGEAA